MRPILFELGSLPVRSYGVMMAIAFLVGIWLARRRAAARGIDPDLIIDLSVFVILASVAGARAAYVIVRWDYFATEPLAVLRVWEGGLAQYGGILVGTVTALIFFRRKGIDIWEGADLLVPSVALGVAIGRLGCFLNGCCFGEVCSLPWGVVFSPDSVAGMQFPGVHVHPTQIYEALIALVVFAVLLAVERRKPFNGFLLWLFVILLSVYRFFIDPLRYYQSESIGLTAGGLVLTNNQLVGIAMVITSLVFMTLLSRRKRA